MLKSALNLGVVLLGLPKQEGINEDWLGEPWALISAAPSLPISGFIGQPRLAIVDDSGKLNINTILTTGQLGVGSAVPNPQGTEQGDSANNFGTYWKEVVQELFVQTGLERQDYNAADFRTLGNRSFGPRNQVAVIHDWIDSDSRSHSSAAFPGDGIESSSEDSWFYNRPFKTLAELAMVPGITLERLTRIAPYIRVGAQNIYRVNVNTAPLQVLIALGFSEPAALELVRERTNLPITREILGTIVEQGAAQLSKATTVRSSVFSIYAQVRMPNVTRWAKANVRVRGSRNRRRVSITSMEIM